MNNTSGVKRFIEYLPVSIKFHKLKNEGLARLIFVLVLFCQLLGSYIPYKVLSQISTENFDLLYSALTMTVPSTLNANETKQVLYPFFIVLGVMLLVKLVSNLFLSVYMYSYISELKGKDTGFAASFKGAFKHLGRLIAYNLLFGLLVMIGLMFFIVPGVIAYIIFVFGYCYILDLKLSISDAFTASNDITRGQKVQIISVFAGFYLIFELPIVLLMSGGSLGAAYLASFFSTISGMVLQRLITQLYMDLEYKKESTAK